MIMLFFPASRADYKKTAGENLRFGLGIAIRHNPTRRLSWLK
jgi:hypothetical protein